MDQFKAEGNVVKNARERISRGDIDKDYVLLLAREVEKCRKVISKLQWENAKYHADFLERSKEIERESLNTGDEVETLITVQKIKKGIPTVILFEGKTYIQKPQAVKYSK